MNYDISSARLMLRYLGKASTKLKEREHARQKLKAEISALRKVSTGSIKRFIDDLEDSIGDAIDAEKRILRSQAKEEDYHQKLQSRIDAIGEKVAALMHAHAMHKQQLGFLETDQEKKDDLRHKLRLKLDRLEQLYAKAKRSKEYSKAELKRVARKIEQLKEKLA
jgi:chromosome segregation ATPase